MKSGLGAHPRITLAIACTLYGLSLVLIDVAPFFVGMYNDTLRISLSQAGFVQTIDQAGGVVGAFWIASEAGYDQVITFDMGGTSTDVSLCPGGIQETTSAVMGGLPISVPMIDKRMLERRPNYAEHKTRIPALFPWKGLKPS